MSTKSIKAFSLTDQDVSDPEIVAALIETVQELEDRVETLEERDEQRVTQIHALASENHELRQQQDQLCQQQEDDREEIEETKQTTQIHNTRLNRFGEWKDELLTYLGVDPEEPLPDEPMDPQRDFEEAELKANSISQTFIEKLTTLPEGVTKSANVKRARFIAMDLKQYAARGRNGWILDAERIKNALYAREQNSAAVHDQTVERVRNILDKNGGDDVVVGQQSHGKKKKIVQFSDNIVSRLSNLAKVREETPSLVCESRIPEEG